MTLGPGQRKAIHAISAASERLEEVLSRPRRSLGFGPILARITEANAIASTTYRWEYSWVEAWVGSGLGAADKSGGLGSTGSGYAYNVSELSNSAALVCPGIDPANIPEGFAPGPVEGHVMLFPFHCSDGDLRWFFEVPVPIDGECPA